MKNHTNNKKNNKNPIYKTMSITVVFLQKTDQEVALRRVLPHSTFVTHNPTAPYRHAGYILNQASFWEQLSCDWALIVTNKVKVQEPIKPTEFKQQLTYFMRNFDLVGHPDLVFLTRRSTMLAHVGDISLRPAPTHINERFVSSTFPLSLFVKT